MLQYCLFCFFFDWHAVTINNFFMDFYCLSAVNFEGDFSGLYSNLTCFIWHRVRLGSVARLRLHLATTFSFSAETIPGAEFRSVVSLLSGLGADRKLFFCNDFSWICGDLHSLDGEFFSATSFVVPIRLFLSFYDRRNSNCSSFLSVKMLIGIITAKM